MRRALGAAVRLARRGQAHDATIRAASLAFYLLLALFPTMLGLLSVLSFLDMAGELAQLDEALAVAMPADVAALVRSELERILAADRGRPLILSLLFTLYYAGRAAGIAIRGIHMAWGIRTRRAWLWVRLMGGALAGGLLTLVILLLSLPRLALLILEQVERLTRWHPDLPGFLFALHFPLMVLIYQQAVNALYRASRRLRGWGWVSWGSVFASAVWVLLGQLFEVYLESFSNLGATYGSLGAAVGLLIYLHSLSWGIFMGAELDAMRSGAPDPLPQRVDHAQG